MVLPVLFESERVIAVDKPAGLLSHATVDKSRPDALSTLRNQLTERDGRAPSLVLLHRLDRDTSGVLLFSKNGADHDRIAKQFRGRQIEKTYLALVARPLRPKEWTIDNHLDLERTSAAKTPRTVSVESGGERAITHFRVLERRGDWSLIEARPETGRRHQIRTHLAQSGFPIVGDLLYKGLDRGRLRLHAWKLRWFEEGETREVEAPLPADFLKS